jgi:hypothetical protein
MSTFFETSVDLVLIMNILKKYFVTIRYSTIEGHGKEGRNVAAFSAAESKKQEVNSFF